MLGMLGKLRLRTYFESDDALLNVARPPSERNKPVTQSGF